VSVEAKSAQGLAGPAGELHGLAEAIVAAMERALTNRDFSAIPNRTLETVMTAAIKLYAAKAEAEGTFAPVAAEMVTPTEVVMVVTELLRATNLNLFDLAMWYRRAR